LSITAFKGDQGEIRITHTTRRLNLFHLPS